jgi:hypothetical protein
MTMSTCLVNRLRWLLALALIAGCGGGVGTGGTGTYSSGPISGFGSIIVNDIRFDDSSAAVIDDDDGVRTRAELKLGMTVEVIGDALANNAGTASAAAQRIRFGSEIVGPVQAVDLAGGRITVLGQTVKVAADTVFDDRLAGGLAALDIGRIVEVYALPGGRSGEYNATRIEPRALALHWRLRGIVAELDAAARSLRIGDLTVRYDAAIGIPPALAVGELVRLRLQPRLDVAGRATGDVFGVARRDPDDHDEARLRGLVTRYSSRTTFAVNGVAVDASAASFPDGTAGLQLGARVEVRGTAAGGLLRASRVDLESDDEVRDRGFELKGPIESVDVIARTFVLRGQVVGYARPDLRLEDGTLADLRAGRAVEVKAVPSADRTRLDAVEIEFD